MSYSATLKIFEKIRENVRNRFRRDSEELKMLQSSPNSTRYAQKTIEKVESIIIDELKNARPKFGILSHYSGEIKGSDERYRWIVNSLSNIENFAHSLPFSTCSIALEYQQDGEREILVSFVLVIGSDEAFFASKGNGAWIQIDSLSQNTRSRIRVSPRKDIDTAITVDDTSGQAKNTVNFNSSILPLVYLACGRVDYAKISNASYTEIAAASLLIRESGGSCVIEEHNGKYTVIASNTSLKIK